MVGLVDFPSPQAPGLGFSVSHQKVELDIDLLSRRLTGTTELTINPHSKDLRIIALNCRQCHVKSVSINGKISSSIPYQDPYDQAKLSWKASVHQYHMLRKKLEPQFKDLPDKELIVNLAKNFKIDELDPFSAEAQNVLVTKIGSTKRDSGDGSAIGLSQSARTGFEQTARFCPIIICINYEIYKIRDGMHFAGGEEEDLRYPHAYTTNSLSTGSACCLFPCLDDLTSRAIWEISIKCSRSIGDALNASQGKSSSLVNRHASLQKGENVNHESIRPDEDFFSYSDEDRALDLVVICTGEMTDEMVDPLDSTKKTTSFISTTALSAQHVGFAIGPFEHVNLTEFRESDEDEKLGQNAVPVHGFCLPGRANETRNTCLPLAKAVDFFTLTYGSYPFTNYKLCFVDDLSSDIVHTGSLSICSNRLLFPENIIEPLDQVSRQLIHALASQWMGINIIPKDPSDIWVVVGIAYYMTDIFMKKLSGNNEYRFRQKQISDHVTDLDNGRPSLSDTGAIISLDPSELEFMAIKAPLVLFILDRRIMKASGSSGLSRIISRIFLNAKVGDMANGAINTTYFIKTCEKLGHAKLESFFQQWVFGAGCPRFRVTQKFNKKKLVVDMIIYQVQAEVDERDLEKDTFIRDLKEEMKENVFAGPTQPIFTGPMTIRIHEADGTPYEHIIEIKERTTKFEIPYNTKYKRLKRSRRQKERTATAAGIEFPNEANDDVLLYCLGDVLQSEEELKEWRLIDWSKDEEDRMSQESYEWIRMDADFEWICKMSIAMPGYMYLSQLQQDRDVVAQLESVQFMASQRAHPLISTILLRTLMDRRYFHGIRTAAAAALAKHAKDELDWIGLFHLEKAFQELFCFVDSPMTRSNNFSDRTSYYIQCAIPQAMAKVRDNEGRVPLRIRNFLLEKLKFNDNSNNEFSDCHYLAVLMKALAETLSAKPAPRFNTYDEDIDLEDDDNIRFHQTCLDEIDRYRRLDEWIPSYRNLLSITALDCKLQLIKAKATVLNLVDFLQYTRDGTSDTLRLTAFNNLLVLDQFKTDAILRWFLFALGTDPSPYVRKQMLHILGRTMGAIAIGESSDLAELAERQDSLIIEQESTTEARQADLARKQTVTGALEALKKEITANEVFKHGLWAAIESSTITLGELDELLAICEWLYPPESGMMVVLKYPHYWKCAKAGKATLKFYRSSRIRTTPLPPRHPPTPHHPPVKLKLQLQPPIPPPPRRTDSTASNNTSTSNPASNSVKTPSFPRPLLKPPKKPSVSAASTSSTSSSLLLSSAPTSSVAGASVPVSGAKPKLKLKLSLKGASGGAGGAGAGAARST